MDFRNCQTATATPAKPGDLPLGLGPETGAGEDEAEIAAVAGRGEASVDGDGQGGGFGGNRLRGGNDFGDSGTGKGSLIDHCTVELDGDLAAGGGLGQVEVDADGRGRGERFEQQNGAWG